MYLRPQYPSSRVILAATTYLHIPLMTVTQSLIRSSVQFRNNAEPRRETDAKLMRQALATLSQALESSAAVVLV
jgi:hypothetical protein